MATSSPKEPASKCISFSGTGQNMVLPSNNLELAAAHAKYYMHQGLHIVKSSIEIRRAMNEAIVFTFGISGAGKSTTLNHLFGIKLAKVSEEEACTGEVSYFVTTLSSKEWEVDNLKIGFVDLPGWGDARGISFQAENMAAIEHFIEEHPHLGNRSRPCFPNIVLIVVNANDNRAKGDASQAVIMLKAIKYLQIIDSKRQNVVIVMTHTLSIPLSSIEGRREIYQGHCRTIFGFAPPFVYVENDYKRHKLPEDNAWTILPDEFETRQPYNLFMAIKNQMQENCDEVGREVVEIFFCSRDKYAPVEMGRVERSQVHKNSVQKWMKRVVHNQTDFIGDSDVSQIIKHHIAKWPRDQKQMLDPLLSELYHCDICTEADLANLNIADVELKLAPYVLQDFEMKLLINLFKVKPLEFPLLHQHILSTYRITNGLYKRIRDKFYIELPDETHTSQGLLLPEFLKAHKFAQSEKRAIEFSYHSSIFPTEESQVGDMTKDVEVTFHVKEILYQIYFDSEYPVRKLKLPEDFLHSIDKLPIDDDESNSNQEEYEVFFKNYGHLVLTEATCGGSIDGTMHFNVVESEFNILLYKYIIYECLQTIITNQDGNIDHLRELIPPNYIELINKFQHTKIKFNGGKTPLFCNTVEDLNAVKYNMWLRSMNKDPVVIDLFDAENIRPLPEMVRKFNLVKGNVLKNAMFRMEDIIRISTGSSLIPLTSLYSGECRDRTQSIKSFLTTVTPEDIKIMQQCLRMGPETEVNLSTSREVPTHQNQPQTDQPPPPPPAVVTKKDPETREEASARVFNRAFLGFAGSSVVNIPDSDGDKLKKVTLEKLNGLIKQSNKPVEALCYFLGSTLMMSPVALDPKSDTTSQLYQFVNVIFNGGQIKIGYYQRILRQKMLNCKMNERFVQAIDLKFGDYIYILNEKSKKLVTTEVIDISTKYEIGCYLPKSDDYNLFIDLVLIPSNQCFPDNARVTLKGGESVRMDEVKIGDYVLSIHPSTGKPVYSKVYLWAHRDPHITATFLHITHPHGHLHISANHLILSGEQMRPVPAGQLQVGDTLHYLQSPTATTTISVPVLHIHTCTQVGYYAPFTNNGLIVVDGIASSVYSQPSTHSHAHVSLCAGVTAGLVERFGMHRVGECVMTPVRVACKLAVGSLVLTEQMDNTTHIHKYCQWLLKIYERLCI